MDKYFLVDYENVGGDGLIGCKQLKVTDRIIIFFTKNAKKLDMTDIADHGESRLEMIEIPSGKQSVDIHIGSYIGYLAGVYKGKECFVQVISKDKDFDNVIAFWNSKSRLSVARKLNIAGKDIEPAEPKRASSKSKTTQGSDSGSVDESDTEMKAKSESGGEAKEKGEASATSSSARAAEGKQSARRTVNEAEIRQNLAKGGFGEDIFSYILRALNKHINEKNAKQLTYRAIISKYGQERGLQIYNRVKKSI